MTLVPINITLSLSDDLGKCHLARCLSGSRELLETTRRGTLGAELLR